ncbi:unnamed protein product [Plutella xylostella]|uniref:(diamondback moth) hypothetical protein n=1 Tax=Plutella xylostella TaxID=51655 RepID=A0A8S4DQS2_PLUXY|nr:unnamed protein product [Plutella xylostella]
MRDFFACCLVLLLFRRLDGALGFTEDGSVSVDETRYAVPVACGGAYCEGARRRRQARVKSRLLDAMLQTPMLRVGPDDRGKDIFTLFSDEYDIPEPFKGPLVEYDFIIVGAGSAGSVLASRLSKTRQASVLLLEAGVGETPFTDAPVMAPLFQQTDYVWPYLMEPQPGVCMGKGF